MVVSIFCCLGHIQFWGGINGSNRTNSKGCNHVTVLPIRLGLFHRTFFPQIDGKPMYITLLARVRMRLSSKKCAAQYLP